MPNSRNTRPNHAKISPLNKPARLNSLEPPYLTSQLQFQWFNAICMTLDIRVLHTSRDLPSIAQNSHSLFINNKELKSTSLIWKNGPPNCFEIKGPPGKIPTETRTSRKNYSPQRSAPKINLDLQNRPHRPKFILLHQIHHETPSLVAHVT